MISCSYLVCEKTATYNFATTLESPTTISRHFLPSLYYVKEHRHVTQQQELTHKHICQVPLSSKAKTYSTCNITSSGDLQHDCCRPFFLQPFATMNTNNLNAYLVRCVRRKFATRQGDKWRTCLGEAEPSEVLAAPAPSERGLSAFAAACTTHKCSGNWCSQGNAPTENLAVCNTSHTASPGNLNGLKHISHSITLLYAAKYHCCSQANIAFLIELAPPT